MQIPPQFTDEQLKQTAELLAKLTPEQKAKLISIAFKRALVILRKGGLV